VKPSNCAFEEVEEKKSKTMVQIQSETNIQASPFPEPTLEISICRRLIVQPE
jgi:hypothetical protein